MLRADWNSPGEQADSGDAVGARYRIFENGPALDHRRGC